MKRLLSWSQLCALLDSASARVAAEQLSLSNYVADWDSLLALAGWSPADFAGELDQHWERVQKPALPAFDC